MAVLLLSGVGLVAIYSATATGATLSRYVPLQTLGICVGFVLMLIIARFDYEVMCDLYIPLIFASSAILLFTAFVADEIGGILGVEAEPFKDVVAFVSCNGNCDATSKTAEYEGVSSCYAESMVYGGNNSCRFGCLGFGDCAAACPANAICIRDGIAHVNTARCLGCGLCTRTCPKGIINMIPQETATVVMCSNKQKGADVKKACKNACIGCKKCEKTCPHDAIKVIDNVAVIDYEKCVHCEACVKECPTGCLRTAFFPDIPADVSSEDLLS